MLLTFLLFCNRQRHGKYRQEIIEQKRGKDRKEIKQTEELVEAGYRTPTCAALQPQ